MAEAKLIRGEQVFRLSTIDRKLIKDLTNALLGREDKDRLTIGRITEPATEPDTTTTEADEEPEQAPERITEPATDALHPAIGYRPRGTR